MAMPRYKYAIGQAPVRFPSPVPKPELESEAGPSDQSQKRSNRKSLANVEVASHINHKRESKDTARLHDAHRKTRSMYHEGAKSSLFAPSSLAPQSTSSRRSSLLGVGGGVEASRSTESFTVRPARQVDKKTPLNSNQQQNMTQRQARPASTSISTSSRPSSLFWTPAPEDHMEAANNSTIKKPMEQRSYGAIESIANRDDPYGYRALAGPALLPSYHEQQQKQLKLKEANNRTCGPTIAVLRDRSWIFASAIGGFLLVAGIMLILL